MEGRNRWASDQAPLGVGIEELVHLVGLGLRHRATPGGHTGVCTRLSTAPKSASVASATARHDSYEVTWPA